MRESFGDWSDPLRMDRKRGEVRMPLGGERGDRNERAHEVFDPG
jgi:hypothetical protein